MPRNAILPDYHPSYGAIERMAVSKAPNALRDVLIVGGLLNRCEELSMGDMNSLFQFCRMCTAHGISLSHALKVRVINNDYAEDFLETPTRAQALILGCLRHSGTPERTCFASAWQSPRAQEPGIWHKTVVQTGARYAANVFFAAENGAGELPTALLAKPPFEEIARVRVERSGNVMAFLARKNCC